MDENPHIKINYVIPDDYRDHYANGAWVGMTPKNEVYIHFHYDRPPIPKSETYEYKEENWTLSKKEVGGDVARIMQTAVVMDLKSATFLRNWLSDIIDKATPKDNKQE